MNCLERLHVDVIEECCSWLDVVSITNFLASCKLLWKHYPKYSDRILPYKDSIQNEDWDAGLEEAIRNQHIVQVSFFLRFCTPEDVCEIATEAARVGNLTIMKMVFKAIHKSSKKIINDIMMQATRSKHREIVDFAITQGADNWNWGLYNAAQVNDKPLIEFFIHQGANSWDSALVAAANSGHKDLIDFFIEKGAVDLNNPLLRAASNGDIATVDHLIERGASAWDTALCEAAEKGHRQLVEFLMQLSCKHGVCFNVKENLLVAVAYDRVEVVDYFLQIQPTYWKDAIAEAASRDSGISMLKWLVKKQEMTKENWNVCLLNAAASGNIEIVKYCIENGADKLAEAKRLQYKYFAMLEAISKKQKFSNQPSINFQAWG